MPKKPATICVRCGALKRDRCEKCGTGDISGWSGDRRRRSRIARGYDKHWLKIVKRKKVANPLCEECERRGRVTKMKQVHHIVPFLGIDDPKRLDWDNLESLCIPCHAMKTGRSESWRG